MIKRVTVALATLLSLALLAPQSAYADGDIIWTAASSGKTVKDDRPIKKPPVGVSARAKSALATNYHYVQGKKDIATSTNTGATQVAVLASQHKPKQETDTLHTLWELAAIDPYAPGGRNIVEVGWDVDDTLFGDSNTHLMCAAWGNDTFFGYGGSPLYPTSGWVDNPNEAVGCGTALATTPSGSAPTNYYQYRIERTPVSRPAWQNQGSGWQVIQQNMGNSPDRIIGYWPDSLWTAIGATFTKIASLRSFWEVASTNLKPCGDMGSGVFGTSASPSAAADSLAFSFAGYAGVNDFDSVDVIPSTDSPQGWRAYDQGTAATPDPDRMRGGGPGWNSAGTGTGSVGSC